MFRKPNRALARREPRIRVRADGFQRLPLYRRPVRLYWNDYRYNTASCLDSTRFTPEELDELAQLIAEPHSQARKLFQRNRAPYSREENAGRKRRKRRLGVHNSLWLTLRALTGGPSVYWRIISEWGLSKPIAYREFMHTILCLHDKLASEISWPTAEEREQLASSLRGLPGCIGRVDGTQVRICRPTLSQSLCYGGKIAAHSFNHQICVDLRGRYDLRCCCCASTDDQTSKPCRFLLTEMHCV